MVEMKDIWTNGEVWTWPNTTLMIRLTILFSKLAGMTKDLAVRPNLYITTKNTIESFKQELDLIGPDRIVPAYATTLAPYDFKYYRFVGGEIDLYGRQPNFWYTHVITGKAYIIWEI